MLSSLKDSAFRVGVSRMTLRRAISEGTLPITKKGKFVFIDSIDLTAWAGAKYGHRSLGVLRAISASNIERERPLPDPIPYAEASFTTYCVGDRQGNKGFDLRHASIERNYSPEARAETRSRSEVFVGAE